MTHYDPLPGTPGFNDEALERLFEAVAEQSRATGVQVPEWSSVGFKWSIQIIDEPVEPLNSETLDQLHRIVSGLPADPKPKKFEVEIR